jgi:hypothetical protein
MPSHAKASIKKKRIRNIIRNPNLPQYASNKNTNQVNPLAWIAISFDNKDTNCGIYQMRKLIVVSEEGCVLPSRMDVSIASALRLSKTVEENQGNVEENIIRASIGKEEFTAWQKGHSITNDNSLYYTMLNSEIDQISLYTQFIGNHFDVRNVHQLTSVKLHATTFLHPQRGQQPIHCWVNFNNDRNDMQDEVQSRLRLTFPPQYEIKMEMWNGPSNVYDFISKLRRDSALEDDATQVNLYCFGNIY